MADSKLAIIGDILRALEGDGVLQPGPGGLPCSILSAKLVPNLYYTPLPYVPQKTLVHVVTDVTMLSLLKTLPESLWRSYLRGELRVALTYDTSMEHHGAQAIRPGEWMNARLDFFGIFGFATDEYTDSLARWSLCWEIIR